MAKKKTRFEELQDYAKGVGLHVATWSPGDGVTRYRFFEKAGNTYFGPDNGIYTALGLKDAWNYLYGGSYYKPARSHATKRGQVHLLKPRGGNACGESGPADADINFVTCEKCQRLHDKHEREVEGHGPSSSSAKHLLAARAARNARHARKKKLTAHEAKQLLESEGIDFSKDYHASVTTSEGSRIAEVAKMAGYKKSKNAPGSTARMYFQYLSRLK
jgi:hypothetical protein